VIPALRGEGTRRAYAPSPWDFVSDQVAQYEATGGQEGGLNEGVPVVILTTVGAKTGKLRKSPLMRVTDGERYVIVGSMGGADQHPQWYFNVLANPEVTLQDGEVVKQYKARVAEGEERAEWWDRAVAVWPDFNEYITRTDRVLPVIVLDPVEG
jgi:deazaflavin-dependent oxidoreductase (nitroreductase family)